MKQETDPVETREDLKRRLANYQRLLQEASTAERHPIEVQIGEITRRLANLKPARDDGPA